MATVIGRLRVLLGLNTSNYSTGIKRAEADTAIFARKQGAVTKALVGQWRRLFLHISLVGVAFKTIGNVRKNFERLTDAGELAGASAAIDRLSDSWNHFIQNVIRSSEPAITGALNSLEKLMQLGKQQDFGLFGRSTMPTDMRRESFSRNVAELERLGSERKRLADQVRRTMFEEFLPDADVPERAQLLSVIAQIEKLESIQRKFFSDFLRDPWKALIPPESPLIRDKAKSRTGRFGSISPLELGLAPNQPSFGGAGGGGPANRMPSNIEKQVAILNDIRDLLRRQRGNPGGLELVA